MRRALSSTDAGDLLRAEHDVQDRLHGLGIDVDLDFVSMAAVANVFRVASAARGHLERTVLADAGLSFTAFTVMWVLWVWGEMESRELAIDAGVTKGTLTGVVGTLERRGLVSRRRDAVDGRLVLVSTTTPGDEPDGQPVRPVQRRRAADRRRARRRRGQAAGAPAAQGAADDGRSRRCRASGDVVGAALVAHVPTIVLPEETRRELNDGHEISLVPGLHRMRTEQLDRLRPDTIVVFDAHWHTTVEFVVAAHARRAGLFTSDELPRGMCRMPYDFPGDPELAGLIAEEVEAAGSWMTPIDDPYLPIHYPTTNLLPFLQGDERWVSVSTAQTAETDDFLLVGEAIGRAVTRSRRRVVLLASGAMSHTFWKLKDLRAHESSDPVHIRTPEARARRSRAHGVAGPWRPRPGHRHDAGVPARQTGGHVRALPDDGRGDRRPGLRRAG